MALLTELSGGFAISVPPSQNRRLPGVPAGLGSSPSFPGCLLSSPAATLPHVAKEAVKVENVSYGRLSLAARCGGCPGFGTHFRYVQSSILSTA